ncbi:hypothetical protein CP98_04522 [Sphingobium yanoikuyae]|uniref:Uncharacterized protein n=1 Tax=Sphingobium yanoikuyae TaxID=13690 RepID=A0A084EBE4_SPHYA|nr:hypothetical protein [Sphingobium yanoikuyae]KEZ15286.1 hypothetical protein CP98_04522 [Sphingobium yanoikuyae]
MTDFFLYSADSPIAPARRCYVVTPHDSNPLPFISKALRAGGDGTITLRTVESDADVLHPVRNGERIDVRASYVRATGTNVSVIAYA